MITFLYIYFIVTMLVFIKGQIPTIKKGWAMAKAAMKIREMVKQSAFVPLTNVETIALHRQIASLEASVQYWQEQYFNALSATRVLPIDAPEENEN